MEGSLFGTSSPLNPLLCLRASLQAVGGGVSGVNGVNALAHVEPVSPTRTEHASMSTIDGRK